jgi:uncharacterized protein (UPF0248 family)
MMMAKDMLNKLKWDKTLEPHRYSVVYVDREVGRIEIPFVYVLGVRDAFFMVPSEKKTREYTLVPIHRIRQFKKEEEVIWERVVE